jgi:hypothetical protein
MTMNITETSLALFLAYANDAGNWSGTPLVGGNVGGDVKAQRGNLTQLKKAGLIKTFTDDGDRPDLVWLEFTAAGKALATQHGIDLGDCHAFHGG